MRGEHHPRVAERGIVYGALPVSARLGQRVKLMVMVCLFTNTACLTADLCWLLIKSIYQCEMIIKRYMKSLIVNAVFFFQYCLKK